MTNMNTNNQNNTPNETSKQEKFLNTISTGAKNVFTKSNLKKAGIALAVIVAVSGGLKWYHHQERMEAHHQMIMAQNAIVQQQAAAKNLTLLDESKVKSIAANAVAADESSLSFRDLMLVDLTMDKHNKGHFHDNKGSRGEHGNRNHGPRSNAPQGNDNQLMNSPQDGPGFMPGAAPSNAPQGGVGDAMSNGPQDNLPQPMNQGVPADDQTNAITTNNVMTTNATNPTVNANSLSQPTQNPLYLVSMKQDKVNYRVVVDAVTGQVLDVNVGDDRQHGPRF